MNKTINKNAMSVARKPSSGRHERKEVLKKDFKVPKTFIPIADELKNQKFKALIKLNKEGKNYWRVELTAKTWKTLIAQSQEIAELKNCNTDVVRQNQDLLAQIERLEAELSSAIQEGDRMRENLIKNQAE